MTQWAIIFWRQLYFLSRKGLWRNEINQRFVNVHQILWTVIAMIVAINTWSQIWHYYHHHKEHKEKIPFYYEQKLHFWNIFLRFHKSFVVVTFLRLQKVTKTWSFQRRERGIIASTWFQTSPWTFARLLLGRHPQPNNNLIQNGCLDIAFVGNDTKHDMFNEIMHGVLFLNDDETFPSNRFVSNKWDYMLFRDVLIFNSSFIRSEFFTENILYQVHIQ